MYIGVVGHPKKVGKKKFNGRIFLERISRTTAVTKLTKHQRFSTDGLINHDIKMGGWRKLHALGTTTVDVMCEYIVEAYELDNEVAHKLEFHYEDWTQGNKKKKFKKA